MSTNGKAKAKKPNRKRGANRTTVPVVVQLKPQANTQTGKQGAAAGKSKRKRNRKKKAAAAAPAVQGSGAYKLSGTTSWNLPFWNGTIGGEVTGSGSYRGPRKNSLLHMVDATGGVPRVVNRQRGEGVVIQHREYVQDLFSGAKDGDNDYSTFSLTPYALNPANPVLFPWLSSVSGNFQEYEFTGVLVELKTMSSNISTTLTLGTMFMSADYNVLAEPPLDKRHLENMENAGSCKPSNSLIMPIECARSQSVDTHLYVGPLGADTGDLRLYDMCNIFIGSYGIPVWDTPIAEIWVTYEVVLYKPKLLPMPANQSNFTFVTFRDGCTDGLNPFGDHVHTPDYSSKAWKFVDGATDLDRALVFPPTPGQTYLCLFRWHGAADPPNGIGVPPALVGSHISSMYAFNLLDPAGYSSTIICPLPLSPPSTELVHDCVLAVIVRVDPLLDPTDVPQLKFLAGGSINEPASLNIFITVVNPALFKTDGNYRTVDDPLTITWKPLPNTADEATETGKMLEWMDQLNLRDPSSFSRFVDALTHVVEATAPGTKRKESQAPESANSGENRSLVPPGIVSGFVDPPVSLSVGTVKLSPPVSAALPPVRYQNPRPPSWPPG